MAIIIVAVMSKNSTIGNGAELPWGKPVRDDMQYFRKLTLGQIVVMGRKTWESIGSKPLADRKENIVLTRNKDYFRDCSAPTHNVDTIRKLAKKADVFIVGGAKIYSIFIPFAEKMYLTFIGESFPGDVFFPEYDRHGWEVIERSVCEKTPESIYRLEFRTLERISPVA